jgi:HK97 family phage major capsid protein
MDPVNALRQAAIEAAATVRVEENQLNALLDAQAAAKTAYRALLKQQADGKLTTDEDKKKLADTEAHAEGFEPRLSAQRKLVGQAKAEQARADTDAKAEEDRLAAETAALKKKPSGRIEVSPPNAAKDPKRGFADHSDFLRAVMRAGRFGQVDERLVPLATQGTDEQQTSANPYGGFFAPVGIAPGVLSVAPELDPIDALVRRIPMTAPTVKFNARVDKNHATSVSGGFRV